ncbi:MAG: glycyl-radical enzyme activating protein [Firmicutes bacterium]|nr:glycyl-radical enzyme activating protein [Bacillota bacterium]
MNVNYDATATVFNIQTYSIHDGPGIRTTVFLKGCPLRCLWCANPESNEAKPQLMTYSSKCTGCGTCVKVCPKGAISIGPYKSGSMEKYIAWTDREKCVNCGACTKVCPAEAREIAGKRMTVREVIEKVKKDKLFYDGSGGGMTVSGGEPLMQPEFTANLMAAAHEAGIHTAIETSSFASKAAVDLVYTHVDLGLLDIKHMDNVTHEKLTGVPNTYILENIRHIAVDLKVPVIIRVATIPGYNDSPENLIATAKFAQTLGDNVLVNLLPAHKLGESKNESLGRENRCEINVPTDEYMESLKRLVEEAGSPCKVGG